MDFPEELQLKSYVENVDTVKDLESKYEISPHKARVYFYPAICQAVRFLPQNSAEAKKLGRESTVRKSPIGEG